MPRTTTLKLDKDGYLHVKLPASVRKQLPKDCTFELHRNGTVLMLAPTYLSGRPFSKESSRRLMDAVNRLRDWCNRENITVADMKHSLKRVRREQRAQSQSDSR